MPCPGGAQKGWEALEPVGIPAMVTAAWVELTLMNRFENTLTRLVGYQPTAKDRWIVEQQATTPRWQSKKSAPEGPQSET